MLIVAVLLLLVALVLFWRSQRVRQKSGLPPGRIVYSDPQLWGKSEKPFYDVETQLTGKPDYLISQGMTMIPVEVKSHYAPAEPYPSHVYQLLAYCFLVQQETGQRPPHGILQYRNRTFEVAYGHEQEAALLDLIEQMREDDRTKNCPRSHEERIRCQRCGFRHVCDQKLG
jgi:CRISPR-associated exonuclease Cas4